MILTEAAYEAITGDTTGWHASAASAAQDLLEDALGRRGKLEEGERTEQVRFSPDGTIYPDAVPLVSVDGGLVFFDDVVFGSSPDANVFSGFFPPVEPAFVTLTYVGGFSSETVPGYMLHDLAWNTWRLLHGDETSTAATPVGATSVAAGDVSVSYGGSGGGSGSVAVVERAVAWSRFTMRHRRRSL